MNIETDVPCNVPLRHPQTQDSTINTANVKIELGGPVKTHSLEFQ